jgi:molybdenum cofactor cytidylyltransferase
LSFPSDLDRPQLAGIVLAAGASSRMGQTKALLPIQPGHTLLGRILDTLSEASLDPLIVVSRARLDIAAAWNHARSSGVIQTINPDPSRGQLSSLLCGLDALASDPPAILLTLVDIPLPRVDTVRSLIDTWQRTRAPLVRPVHGRRHGHPVIFGATLLMALRAADPAEGAKPLVRAFAGRGVDVVVDDAGVLLDIDTPDDYRRLIQP